MILILSDKPEEIPPMLDDATLSGMIAELANALLNITGVPDDDPGRFSMLEITKAQRAFSEWGATYAANYAYLVDLAMKCCEEFSYRKEVDVNCAISGKESRCTIAHESQPVIEWCDLNRPDLPLKERSPFPICVPSKYIEYLSSTVRYGSPRTVDIEQSYRNYYRAKLHKGIEEIACCANKFTEVCCLCAPSGFRILNKAEWTRREKPEWI